MSEYIEVYQNRGTIEYPFPTQELASFSNKNESELSALAYLAKVAFGRTQSKRLVPYPEVPLLLETLRGHGWLIFAVTNAPMYRAYLRLKRIGIKNFNGISAWAGDAETGDLTADKLDLIRKENNALSNLEKWNIKLMTFPTNQIKPNPTMFNNVINYANKTYGDDLDFWAIGDNVLNDLSPCNNLDVKTVWAKYGTDISTKELNTMMEITPWQRKHRNDNNNLTKTESWDFTANSVRDLFTILKVPYQQSLML